MTNRSTTAGWTPAGPMAAAPALRDLRAPLLAWAAAALLSIFLHGPLPLYSTRSLAVAWEMWDAGSWLVPLFNGAPYSHKTPLLPWLIHAGWLVAGVNDAWPRLLMVLLGTVAIAQAGVLAGRLYPHKAGLPALAAWAMAGFWYFFLFSLQVMYELPLTVAVLGGLLALCRRDGEDWRPWWPGVALAVGFGLLAKGPVVLLHLGVPLLAARWWHPAAQDGQGAAFARKAGLAVLAGIGLFTLWLVPALTLGDPEYREALLVTQTAGRIRDSFDHAEPWWWYAPMLLVLMAPWWWSRWWWSQVPALWREPGNRFVWTWLLGVLLAFSAISGKNAYYLLPVFAAFAILLALAAHARPRLGIAAGAAVLAIAVVLLAVPALADRIRQPFPEALLTSLPLTGGVLAVAGIAMLRWRSFRVQAGGVLLAIVVLHAAVTPLLKSQFDFTPTAHLLGQAQRAGTRIAFLGEYQLQFHFAGRLREPLEVLDEAGARAWAERHPRALLVVNTREDWRVPGPQPVAQQRFRTRWIQVWRAGEWRGLPAQQLPLQATTGQLRTQPR
jgi:4-amino-4-deoxy-L-arabinose transferase-like glycosyltransferase